MATRLKNLSEIIDTIDAKMYNIACVIKPVAD